MTLKKLLRLLREIEDVYACVGYLHMRGSYIYAGGSGELTLSFNTQPPRALDSLLRREGFIVWGGEYIYRPRIRARPPTKAMIQSATLRTK